MLNDAVFFPLCDTSVQMGTSKLTLIVFSPRCGLGVNEKYFSLFEVETVIC